MAESAAIFAHIPELLHLVVDNIRSPVELGKFRLVNRTFHDIATETLFREFHITGINRNRAEALAASPHRQHVRELCLHSRTRLKDTLTYQNAVTKLIRRLPNLTSLRWTHPIDKYQLGVLMKSCPKLKSLHINTANLFPDPFLREPPMESYARRLPLPDVYGLQDLSLYNLRGCAMTNREFVKLLHDNAPTLRSLHLSARAMEHDSCRTCFPDPDRELTGKLYGSINVMLDDLFNTYIFLARSRHPQDRAMVPPPLKLTTLTIGLGVCAPGSLVRAKRLFDLSGLEEVHLTNRKRLPKTAPNYNYALFGPDNCPNLRVYTAAPIYDRLYDYLNQQDTAWTSQLAVCCQQGYAAVNWDERPRGKPVVNVLHAVRMMNIDLCISKRPRPSASSSAAKVADEELVESSFTQIKRWGDGIIEGICVAMEVQDGQLLYLDLVRDLFCNLHSLTCVSLVYGHIHAISPASRVEIARDLAKAIPTLVYIHMGADAWRVWRTGPYGQTVWSVEEDEEETHENEEDEPDVRLEVLFSAEFKCIEFYRLNTQEL
ncbi:hypothetical protein SBRCBS47491_008879 [Sporothrix bragantina]|uniref:F-box domain-containing protein n=1 Tax=Sporothrix bragantina TaxID=671064 RepID=A0ABP0CQG9_9PEZI